MWFLVSKDNTDWLLLQRWPALNFQSLVISTIHNFKGWCKYLIPDIFVFFWKITILYQKLVYLNLKIILSVAMACNPNCVMHNIALLCCCYLQKGLSLYEKVLQIETNWVLRQKLLLLSSHVKEIMIENEKSQKCIWQIWITGKVYSIKFIILFVLLTPDAIFKKFIGMQILDCFMDKKIQEWKWKVLLCA